MDVGMISAIMVTDQGSDGALSFKPRRKYDSRKQSNIADKAPVIRTLRAALVGKCAATGDRGFVIWHGRRSNPG